MKNKKGFTLVELLAVIAILAVLAVIAVPSYNAVSKNIKQKMRDSKVDTIAAAVELYAQDHKNNCDSGLTIQALIDGDYLKADDKSGEIKDPVTGEAISGVISENSILNIDVSSICAKAGGNKPLQSSDAYIASVNEKLDKQNAKYTDIYPSSSYYYERKSLQDAYEQCKKVGLSYCSILSPSNFNSDDSDYEDYRVAGNINTGDLHIYRALYKYTITVNKLDINGEKTKINEIKVKVDDDNAEDVLNGVSIPAGYTYKSDCFGLNYYEEWNEFQINTSGTHDKNITCSIDFEPQKYDIAIFYDEHINSIDGKSFNNGFIYLNGVRVGEEFEFSLDDGYKATYFGCGGQAGEVVYPNNQPPYFIFKGDGPYGSDCSLTVEKE